MAIKQPTTLSIITAAEIKVDIGSGATNLSRIFTNTTTLAFSSYSTGSIDVDSRTADFVMGRMSAGIFSCDTAVDFMTDEMSNPITTKIFSYSGAPTMLTISSSSLVPITVEYIMGSTL